MPVPGDLFEAPSEQVAMVHVNYQRSHHLRIESRSALRDDVRSYGRTWTKVSTLQVIKKELNSPLDWFLARGSDRDLSR